MEQSAAAEISKGSLMFASSAAASVVFFSLPLQEKVQKG